MPAGTAIGEGDLWWCSVDPSLCIENLGKTVVTPQNQLFSVLRTGTGDLDLASAGNLTQWSPYGVYTAGTQAADVATGFNQPRGLFNGSVLGAGGADYEVLQPASTRPGIRNMAATSISPLAVMWLAINGPRN